MMQTKPIQTTKWGTACAQCAAAKAKCSGRSGTQGSKCDRCERLLKQCTDQVHKPRKTRQSRHSQHPDTESTSYDGMLDSMVSTPENPSSPSAAELGLETSVGRHLSGHHDRPFLVRASSALSQHHVDSNLVGVPEAYSGNPFYSMPTALGQYRDMVFKGREDVDQVLLSKYRAELMPQHPFVIVPDHIQAAALKVHHPFLMLAIRVVASFENLRTMHAKMHQVTGYLADRMFRQAERSLDLLMGIVVILGWHHYHCSRHNQLNNLLCLAESLVSDLGLNKRSPTGDGGVEDGRAIEEKRLLLGVWYLRSSAAMHLQKLTSMPFTAYMRQCLVDIPEAKDHNIDRILIHFVKVQYLAERVAVLKSPQQRRADPDRMGFEGSDQDKESQERGAALAGCQAYLDRLARELPASLKEDAMIVSQFNTVALRLSEPRGSDVVCPRSVISSSTQTLPSDSPTIETLLQSAPAAIRGWFQSWVSGVPAASYRALSSHAILQLLYAVGAVMRSSAPDQSSSHRRPFQGQEGSVAGSSVSSGQSGPSTIENAMTILNRLIALGVTGPDTDKFWAALGEGYDDECAQAGGATGHHLADELSELGEDVLSAVMSAGIQRNPRRGATRGELNSLSASVSGLSDSSGGHPPLSERQTSQPLYQNMFIPPSRVPSVGPGQREYNEVTLVPPVLLAGPQVPQPGQWVAAGPWDVGAPSWPAQEDTDAQMWPRETGQGNPPYGWGADRRY